MNFAQIKAIEKANKERILKANASVPDTSGVYVLTREEDGFKYAYVGQAKHILTRLAQHLKGFQHIDISLKKRGLYDEEKNPTGWAISYYTCHVEALDTVEQHTIRKYADWGYQLYNHTAGGQGKGKKSLKQAPRKGYRAGIEQGYTNARRDISRLFDKHLIYRAKKEPPTKTQQKAIEKFEEFINVGGGDDG